MTSLLLTPCKLRNDRIVPVKDVPALRMEWAEIRERLAPSREENALLNLRKLDKGSFVGLLRAKTGEVRNFILKNPDRSDTVDWLLEKDPTFPERLIEVFRVEEANWEASMSEPA